MSLNQSEIGQLARTLTALEGGFLQKIQLPDARHLFLEVRRPGRSFRLLLCVASEATRLHLSTQRAESPATPLPFQGLLRARLMGSQLTRIEQLPGERVVALSFESAEARHRLIAELTGRHGNLFLLDASGVILGSAVASSSSKRALRPGAAYEPPLPIDRVSVAATEASRFEGLTELDALSRTIEAQYRDLEVGAQLAAERLARLRPLRAELKKTLRALDKARADLARTDEAEAALRRGNLLKANLHRLTKGQRSIQLTEYTADGVFDVALDLDPALTPQQQVEAAFRRYRRLTSGRAKAGARVASLEAQVGALEQRIDRIEHSEALGDSGARSNLDDAPERSPPPMSSLRSIRMASPTHSLPFREYRSSAGQRIWVGRSARHNDALTFKCAKGNDVWLHARGVPGSHVVVPLERGEALHEETRRDALELALHFSNSRGNAAEVSWTHAKYVRRQKGGAPGAVTYSQERTALVRPDTARLARLLSPMPMPPTDPS
ncbi:MAG: NFACT family protein [Myxococcales bacterium]|jgi:predicted ribosome quality control (RQC) complex YloA/Tae2 family protein|nr:NFACT family protein [Myxococcales bacterium]